MESDRSNQKAYSYSSSIQDFTPVIWTQFVLQEWEIMMHGDATDTDQIQVTSEAGRIETTGQNSTSTHQPAVDTTDRASDQAWHPRQQRCPTTRLS